VGKGSGADGPAEFGEGVRLQAGKNRHAQVVRSGRRQFFQGRRREEFLEWFAATGSVVYSAGKAGVSDKTVWKHRMNDPVFAEAFDRAQEQGVARVRALSLQGKKGPIAIDGDWEAPELDDFDPAVVALILREDERRKAGGGRQPGRAPRAATNAQVDAELGRRLEVYKRRVRASAAAAGRACPACGRVWEVEAAAGECAAGAGA
jgi:hypothetical protein